MTTTDDTPFAHDLIWGAAAIGDEIGRDTRGTFHLLENGIIPAKKIGRSWVASRRQLRAALIGDDAEGPQPEPAPSNLAPPRRGRPRAGR